MRLMATLRWDGTWTAELDELSGRQRGGRRVCALPDDAIRTLTNDVQELIVTADSKIANAGVCDVFHV